MANATQMADDASEFLRTAMPVARDAAAKAAFLELCRQRKGKEGIGRKREIDKQLDELLDSYLLRLSRQELSELYKTTGE